MYKTIRSAVLEVHPQADLPEDLYTLEDLLQLLKTCGIEITLEVRSREYLSAPAEEQKRLLKRFKEQSIGESIQKNWRMFITDWRNSKRRPRKSASGGKEILPL